MGSCFMIPREGPKAENRIPVAKKPQPDRIENVACGQIAIIADKAARGEKPSK